MHFTEEIPTASFSIVNNISSVNAQSRLYERAISVCRRVSGVRSADQSQIVNEIAAQSRIRGANMAWETASVTRFDILTQRGMAALVLADQSSAAVLALLAQDYKSA